EGVGIQPTALTRIFNAFEQADSSRTRHFGGLGLGLTIAKALADAHGAELRATSDGQGCGATFTFEMPAAPAPLSEPERTSHSVRAGGDSCPMRVLLVEDHAGTLALMVKLLQSLGHQVKPAASVRDALALVEREEIDLVISDLGLPDGSGYDVM